MNKSSIVLCAILAICYFIIGISIIIQDRSLLSGILYLLSSIMYGILVIQNIRKGE